MNRARVFAPASVGNAAVGFDLLGFAFDSVGDEVTVERGPAGVEISAIDGVVRDLPREASRNTAGQALLAMIQELKLSHGFRISIRKGIPMGSGMGGSAASAVGAVVAANALLEKPLAPHALLPFALAGEAVASGAAHADNIAPCLLGGLTLALPDPILDVLELPTPAGIHGVLVHPNLVVETKAARAILSPTLSLAQHVRQSGSLAGFILGCQRNDHELIRRHLRDLVIEPQRAQLIPGFARAKAAALAAGALGFSISGSGPSVFAWAANAADGEKIRAAVAAEFTAVGCDSWVAPLPCRGARVVETA